MLGHRGQGQVEHFACKTCWHDVHYSFYPITSKLHTEVILCWIMGVKVQTWTFCETLFAQYRLQNHFWQFDSVSPSVKVTLSSLKKKPSILTITPYCHFFMWKILVLIYLIVVNGVSLPCLKFVSSRSRSQCTYN